VISISMGIRLARARLLTLMSTFALVGAVALAGLCAALERANSVPLAADRALAGAACGLLLPIGAYFLIENLCSGRALNEMLRVATRHGTNGRAAALGALAVTAAVAAVFASALAAVSVLVARTPADPQWVPDAARSVPVAALGSLGYVCLFAMGSVFGPRGQGRSVLLVADWLLGSGSSMLALPWPRGHLRDLLGLEPVLGIGQPLASIFLVVLSAVFLGVALYRVRP
jgi:hypothetical protein